MYTLWMAVMVVLAEVPASIQATPKATSIYGGHEVPTGAWPGVVAILAGDYLCTGTVVAPQLVLTAAHCLADVPSSNQVTVLFGENIDAPSDSIKSSRHAIHPRYCGDPNCDGDAYDYAYIVVDGSVSLPGGFVSVLTDQDEWDQLMRPEQDITLVGFGETEDHTLPESGRGIKREVTTNIRELRSSGLGFLAGGDNRDSCNGDSGGPAFATLADGAWRMVGVTSRGYECGKGGYYEVPYAALCWLRDDAGVDLVPEGCESCDCLDTSPPRRRHDSACRVGSQGAFDVAWLAWLAWLIWPGMLMGARATTRKARRSTNAAR